jgi:peptidoglycan/xylan/chitin deacetylase (PgdA/CDA1 family)
VINRRNALFVIGATVLGGLRPLHAAVDGLLQTPATPQSAGASKDDVEDRLRKDLAPHEYSEEGIPVFLACEDLTKRPALTPLNAAVASEMRRNAQAMQRVKPDVEGGDVAKLIEVLAQRDFARGSTVAESGPAKPNFLENAGRLAEIFETHPLIRAVNFHNTARAQADLYERQLAQYSRYYSAVTAEDLDQYITTGEWHKPKPGLIVSVFEGYRNSYDVLAPLIEKYGFIGWFWMITGFLNTPVPDQRDYADHHDIDMLTHEYPDGRYALTWEELRQLDKKHVIAGHTRSHTLLSALPPDVQRQEVVGSQEDFKKNLGHPVRYFVSLTGPAYGENEAIDRLIREAGYDTVFSNFLIQRISTKHVYDKGKH